MKLGLGTVQFGSAYGAFNQRGMPDRAEISRCLDLAAGAGIEVLDTARAYGGSEEALGALDAASHFRIVTKVPPLLDGRAEGHVSDSLNQSLALLRAERVYGVMLHSAADLLDPSGDRLWRDLEAIRASGLAERVGVSVYHPGEARELLDRYPISLIQLPFNIFDQRFLRSGVLAYCSERGVEVHARSIFLQGAILQEPASLPRHLLAFAPHLRKFRGFLDDVGIGPLAAALGFVFARPELATCIVGVDCSGQLEAILAATKAAKHVPLESLGAMVINDESLLNPARWPS